jgi:hypothetical protein
LDAEVLAQPFHVGQQVPGGVVAHVRGGVAGVRRAPPAGTLVEQDHLVPLRIEVPAVARRAPRSRPAVHHQGRLALRVAAGFPVHEVPVADVEHSLVVRLDRRIELVHVVTLPLQPVWPAA